VLLWGEPLRPLAAAAAAWGLTRGAGVLVVDAANRFDPYGLVREARRQGLATQAALARVKVARAFTSHQLVRLLEEGLLPALESGSLVLLLGPVTLFYDEQVPLTERRRLFNDLVQVLAAVKTRAPLLLLQPPLPRGATNRHFGRLLAPVVDYFVEVGGNLRGGPGDFFVSGPSASPQTPLPTPCKRGRESRGLRPPLPRPNNL
jgi:hypothetical protein